MSASTATAQEARQSRARVRLGTGSARIRRLALRTLSVVLFFALWYAVTWLNRAAHWFNPLLLPPPDKVLEAGIELVRTGELQHDIAASLYRVVVGFVIASVLGVATGLLVGTWRTLEDLLDPMIELLRPIPPLAFLPMMVLWFGIGEGSKIAFIAYAAFFPVFTTTLEGIKFVDPVLLRAASSLGATRAEMFRYVIFPAALPAIITGLRLAFGLSFFVIVAAEFIAADSGLGYLINDARTFFLVSNMLLGAAVIGIIGFTFNIALRRLEHALLRWRRPARP